MPIFRSHAPGPLPVALLLVLGHGCPHASGDLSLWSSRRNRSRLESGPQTPPGAGPCDPNAGQALPTGMPSPVWLVGGQTNLVRRRLPPASSPLPEKSAVAADSARARQICVPQGRHFWAGEPFLAPRHFRAHLPFSRFFSLSSPPSTK